MNAVEVEFFDQLVECVYLFFFAGGPPKQCKKVAKRGGKETGVAIRRHRNDLAVLAFRQLTFVRRHYQRQMGKCRRRHAESLIDQHLFVRVCEVILAANDMGDPHLNVVADNR